MLSIALSLGNGPHSFNGPLLLSSRAYPDFLLHSSHQSAYVVLLKENHTRFEAAILDRKSGEADLSRLAVEGSAVRHSGAPNLPFHSHFPMVILKDDTATARPRSGDQRSLRPLRYTELIPVRASRFGLGAELWPWSSAACHCGANEQDKCAA